MPSSSQRISSRSHSVSGELPPEPHSSSAPSQSVGAPPPPVCGSPPSAFCAPEPPVFRLPPEGLPESSLADPPSAAGSPSASEPPCLPCVVSPQAIATARPRGSTSQREEFNAMCPSYQGSQRAER